MRTLILPFGPPAWERRKAIFKEIIAAKNGPPYDFRDVLYLVGNERAVRQLKLLFLDALMESVGVMACIPPGLFALNRYLGLKAGAASSLPLVDDTSRTLALEEICREEAGKAQGIGVAPDVLGPSIVASVSCALDNVYMYGVDGRALAAVSGDSISISLLAGIKKSYEAWLKAHGLADPAAAIAAYRPRPDDFAGVKTAVIDGFYDADPAEARLLSALAEVAVCTAIIEAPGIERDESRGEGMPYFGADRLSSALGVDISGVRPDTGVQGREAAAVSGAVFEGRTFRQTLADVEAIKPLSVDVSVTGAVSPAEEVWYIARDIKSGFLEGTIRDLNRVLVFFPDLDGYLPLLEEAFRDLGIPYHVSQGRPLLQSPVVTAFMDLLQVPVGRYSFRDMRRVFGSPFVKLSEGGNRAGEFDRTARAEGITGGVRAWRDMAARMADADLGPCIERLLEVAETVDMGPAQLSRWVQAAYRLLDTSGIKDAAHAMAGSMPHLGGALSMLAEVLSGLEAASARLKGRMGAGEFVYILKRALRDRRTREGSNTVTGVRVLGRSETSSEPFDVIYAAGLTENSLPAPRRTDIFFPEHVARKLGLPAQADTRARDARLFLGLVLGARRVHLVYPQSRDGGAVPRSPYLRALEPFFKAKAVTEGKNACRPVDPGEALGKGELLRAQALSYIGQAPPGDVTFSETRLKPPTPPDKDRFSVTELEEYMLCHYRYYQGRVLNAAAIEEPEDDIAPHRAGSIVHYILKDFYDGAAGPVTDDNKAAELARLRAIAGARFRDLPESAGNRELVRRFDRVLAPRFIEAEAELFKAGPFSCFTEVPVEIDMDVPDRGHVKITGKIDRLEISGDGSFTVADYKTGSYPGSGRPLKEQFQLPVYAYIVCKGGVRADGDKVPAGRPSSLVYYNLKKGTMRDVVLYDASTAPDSVKKKFPRRKADAEQFNAALEQGMQDAEYAVRGILSGEFEPTCTVDIICRKCDYAASCRRGRSVDEPEDEGGQGSGEGAEYGEA